MGVALQIVRSNQNWIGKSPTWICFVTCDFLGERQGIVIPIYTGSGAARKSNGANFVGKNRSANFVRRCGCCCNRHLYKLVTKWIASAQRVTSILPTFESRYACNRRCYQRYSEFRVYQHLLESIHLALSKDASTQLQQDLVDPRIT